jgi:signal transduction histidine kinase/ActR/RegA family two-component response regulator
MSPRRYVILAGCVAAAFGAVMLSLWLSGDPALIRFVAWRGKTNTCVGLLLGGLSLVAVSSQRAVVRGIGGALAGAVILLAVLTLLEYTAGIDLGVDELIARDWPFPESAAHPNRMAPNAALSFLLFGPAVLLALRSRRLASVGQSLALALIALDAVALIGYLYDAAFLYSAGEMLRISPYTALCFVALGSGVLMLRPELGVPARLSGDGIGAYLARRLLVPVVVLPPVLDWLGLQGENLGWWDATTGKALDALVYIAVVVVLVLYLAHSLDVIDARRKRSELELRRAGELTAALAQARTVDEVARVAIEIGVSALEAGAGAMFVVEPGGARLRMIASCGYPAEVSRVYETLPLTARVPICDAVREHSMVFLAGVDELRTRYPDATWLQPETRAVAGVPLIASGRVLGAVHLSFHAQLPDAEARARIDHLIGQCGLAFERAALFDSERAAREAARAADRSKDAFLAMLGHELRNPLAPIITALELMQLRDPEPHREREIIERQVRHMTRLVDDLLDVSRIARGKVELARSRVELSAAVDDAVELVRSLADERRHTLVVQADPELAIDGDRARVVQIVSNLLTNAVKYTPPGGRIELVARRQGDGAVVQCTDNGVGIPAELLPQIFEPFVQHEATIERAMGGLGLGLAIVRSLVALHGGTVEAASDGAGKGATFTVAFPALAVAAVAALPAPVLPGRTGAPRRVLIVDDNQDAAEMMGKALALAGHTVQIAHDGARGLELAAQFDPDCVLLDIGLPTIDGYDVARQLRDHDGDRHRTLVAITGYGQDHDIRRALDAGFDRHLVKPVSFAVAMEIVEAAAPVTRARPGS